MPTRPSPRAPGFLAILWLALIAQAIFLSRLRNGASFDGAEQLLYTQYLDLGYGRSQPPLYTWLLIASQQVFGVTLLAENLLKFALAGTAFTAIHHAALHLWQSRTAARTSVLLCLLVIEIVWEMQRNYSHSILLFALTSAMFLAWLALTQRPTALRYAGFGVLLGLMVLSKYNALLIIAALVLADLWVMRRASVFARRQTLITVATAFAVTAPHLVWASLHTDDVTALSGSFAVGTGGFLQNGATALVALALALLSLVVLIFAFTLVTLGPRAATRLFGQARWTSPEPDSVILLAIALFVALSLTLALTTSATAIRPRWLLPVIVPLVLWLGGQMPLHTPRAARALTGTALALAILACIGLVVEERRPGARTAFDYGTLTAQLRTSLHPGALIFDEYQTFANLRLSDPRLVLVHPAMPRLPDLRQTTHPVAIWSGDVQDGAEVLRFAATLGLSPPAASAPKPFTLTRPHGPSRQVFAQPLTSGGP